MQVSAAEIRLKKGPVTCTGNLVLLGDVAEVLPNRSGENAEQLRQTVLFSAPHGSEQRTVTAMELRNIFARIGIKSIEHQFTGAVKTVITNGSLPAPNPLRNPLIRQANFLTLSKSEHNGDVADDVSGSENTNSFVSQKLIQTLEKQLAEAINVYLDSVSDDETSKNAERKITVKLDAEHAHRLATGGKIIEINGGTIPFTGKQQFEILMSRADAATQRNAAVKVDADITETQKILCASRSLPKGHIINENDLTFTAAENGKGGDGFVKASDVLGMETVSAIREKGALSAAALKRPAWVRKGDVITVRSINNRITVRTNGIAQEDGSENDIIPVSILDTAVLKNGTKSSRQNRNEQPTFTARVANPKTVEVYAGTALVREQVMGDSYNSK